MKIITIFKGDGIRHTVVSTEATLEGDIKTLTKMIVPADDSKYMRWIQDEPTQKKAWKYRGYSMHWDKGREAWVMMKDGYEEWYACTRGEVKEWIDGSKDEGR